ncbi:leucine-rich repeat protein [Perkinsela sp. CCAP 1560/4]|nr:leucine-rich repeat protein [Perkinsela sp. CCAP 1560/4]|eukprot:KNH07905.1 leucine-rich repeat protein [Perkinsela sp. CCAP 1560/4]
MSFLAVLRFATDDKSAIGRFEISSLSEQTLIELLAGSFRNQGKFRDSNQEFRALSDIDGIEVDDGGFVHKLDCFRGSLYGTLDMMYLPQRIVEIDVAENDLAGTFYAERIPPHTRIALFEENMLEGSVDLQKLSMKIRCLQLYQNRLSGTVNFLYIPEGLVFLNLRENTLEGTIDLSKVQRPLHLASVRVVCDFLNDQESPDQMSKLFIDLRKNCFAGTIFVQDIQRLDIEIFGHRGAIVDKHGNILLLDGSS